MKWISLLSVMLISSCMSVGSLDAYCANTKQDINSLQNALIVDGGPQSKVAGVVVIKKWDVVCQP